MIEIKKTLQGYTSITYKGEEIARHNLSATTQGTREAFDVPENTSFYTWIRNNFEKEMREIDAKHPSEA